MKANYHKIFGALFTLMLVTPGILLLSDVFKGSAPKLKVQKNQSELVAFDNYFSKNYGLKTPSANLYMSVKNRVLKESPLPHKVVKGKDGWYFLGNSFNNSLDNAFGNDALTSEELRKIAEKIGSVKSYLDQKGIKFYLVVPRDKNQIYKEQLPFKLKQKKTKFDVLSRYLKDSVGVNIIDVKDIFLSSKKDQQLYFKSDTHWNDFGAYLGYKHILEVINKDIEVPIVPQSEFVDIRQSRNFDLTRMIQIDLKDSIYKLVKKTPTLSTAKKTNKYYRHYVNPEKTLKIMIHGDSFFNALTQFFNESFGESFYLRSYRLNKNYVEQDKPDIVIFELIERNIQILAK